MPVGELHGQVAAIALRAASRHGFALGGGNALMAHGVIDRGDTVFAPYGLTPADVADLRVRFAAWPCT